MLQLTDKRNKVLIYLIFLLVLSTISGKISKQPKKYSLKIDKIEVSGLSSSKNLEIQNDLSIFLYQNIFILQKENISEIINKHNIIEKYTIKKIYPSTLIIELKPTKFLAKIVDNKHLLVGSNGKLISSDQNEKILPYIFGEFNKKKFLKFKKNIETSKFNFSEFKTIYFFPSNRWDILTTDDILIKLPQGNIFEPLNLAYKIISNIQFKDKNIIDLRINNYLNVK
jgi:cell division protein FtsQ